jgi:hypothetical protein
LANQVTDNRTDIADGTTVSGWEDIGSTALAVDTEIRYDTYSGSIGNYVTTTRDATMFDNAGIGLFASGDHAYLLVNCGVVSLLDTKALGGLTVRVTGATITDWAEFELFGSDEWPAAFAGGWIQIVVDIDELLANPTNTNGSPPTVANIQRFGVTYITASVMPRMTDNIWVGGFAILGSATPAIIIEGRDGGSSDWEWSSVAAVAAIQLSAVLKPGPGGSYVCRGPVQIGINDSSTHAFSDTNKTLLWDFQEVMLDGFYGLSALGNSGGSTDVNFGLKTGTGDDATGAQGGVIQADPLGARWTLDFDDPDIDSANFYGVVMLHGDTFQLDDPAVSCISTLYIDCTRAIINNSEQLRVSIIDANTADGVAFMVTDDMADIVFSSFEFSDGHAIELNAATPTAQTNKGNLFSGYTNSVDSTDAAILNSAAGALVISNGDGSNLGTNSYRNTGGGSVSVVASVTVTFTVVDEAGDPIEFAKVFLETDPGGVDIIAYDLTNASGVVTTSYSDSTPQAVTGFVRKGTNSPVFKAVPINNTIGTDGLSATITMVSDE